VKKTHICCSKKLYTQFAICNYVYFFFKKLCFLYINWFIFCT